MKRRGHVDAIAGLVAAEVDRTPPRTARRLRRELAAVALELDPVLARELGALDLVERCRDEHLASLDADAGLLVLRISWQEILARATSYRDRSGFS
jgi:hypothetical protein